MIIVINFLSVSDNFSHSSEKKGEDMDHHSLCQWLFNHESANHDDSFDNFFIVFLIK